MLLHAILILLGITFMVPLLWTLSTSFKHPGQVFTRPIQWIPQTLRWSNYQEVWTILPMPLFIRNTMVISVTALIGTLLSTSLCGYSFARLRWPGREKVFALVIGTMMLPGAVLLVPQFVLFRSLGWIDTFFPLIVPAWLGGGAFYIFLYRQFCSNIPYEMDEAAIMDGAGYFRIFWQIILPLTRPALITIGLFSFLSHYNDFMGPLIYLNSNRNYTLSLGLRMYQGRFGYDWHWVMAASVITVAPVIVIFFLAQEQFIAGVQLTGLAGR
ncbi:MAG: carbohydrate ABC transporter permease [Anaerolineae bacterium]|nr:carbohydrate ABC transporter permease [Anaerolineae bacterium]